MSAVCVLRDQVTGEKIGIATFVEQQGQYVSINVRIQSTTVSRGLHGLHVHRLGDVRQGCASVCDHFNPHGQLHGNRDDPLRKKHAGDLGNININASGRGSVTFITQELRVNPASHLSVIGRSLVLHALPDDLGRVNTKESQTTGSSGARIACGVIGRADTPLR